MSPDVFISYSSKDSLAATSVCHAIESSGFGCWIAPRNIVPGREWSEEIIDALNGCRAIVLIFSSHSNASPQVLREIERGVNKRIPILVFRIEDVSLSKAMEYFLSVPHWFDAVHPPLEKHLESLTRAIAALLAESGASQKDTREPTVARPVHHLPPEVTTFVGREEELRSVKALFESGARLITLLGPGGCGKTRIARQVAAARLDLYTGGVWWADLESAADAEQVIPMLAATLGVKEEAGSSLLQLLSAALRSAPHLLVLDNFEHVIAAASQIDELLRLCPELTVLITSSSSLNLSSEHLYVIPSMTLSESVALFEVRARQARAQFRLDVTTLPQVESLCRRLEGIPLALELAAAQVRMLTVPQIEKQLSQRFRVLVSPFGDVTPRQRTLRAAIDWSYTLLTAEQQRLFAHLSIFVGGFTLEAATELCPGVDVFSGISRLREQSFLSIYDTGQAFRFQTLETLREYGQERLADSGEAEAVAASHALYFSEWACRSEYDLLVEEEENVRAAWEWLLLHGEADTLATLTEALMELWERRGRLQEGRSCVTRCLERAAELTEVQLHARLLVRAGWFAYLQGDYEAATLLQESSLVLCRAADDLDGECNALNNLALTAQAQGRLGEAAGYFEASLELARALEEDSKQAARLSNLGLLAIREGRLEQAKEFLEEASLLFQRNHDLSQEAVCLCNLSFLAVQQQDWAQVEALSEQALSVFHSLNDQQGIAITLSNLAEAQTQCEKHDDALMQLHEALVTSLDIGIRWLVPELLEVAGRNLSAVGRTREALLCLLVANQLRETMGAPRSEAEVAVLLPIEQSVKEQLGVATVRVLQVRARSKTPEALVGEIWDERGTES